MTKVIYRQYRGEPRHGIAIFPEVPNDNAGAYAVCYEEVGEHGGCDVQAVISMTRPASPEVVERMGRLLVGRGYELEPVTRTPRDAYQTRRREAQKEG